MEVAEKSYCELDFFDEILSKRKEEGPYAFLYKFLRRNCNIYLDIDKETFDQRRAQSSIYHSLWKRENLSFKAKLGWQQRINKEELVDEVFFVNKDKSKEAKLQREEYGVLVIANNENDLAYFKRISRTQPFILVPQKERIDGQNITYPNSWGEVFDKIKLTPINAILITDNYMFGDKFNDRKEYSLYSILRSIAPKGLKRPLHITLFVENSPDKNTLRVPLSKKDAEKVIEEIKGLKLCDDVKVTIVAHNIRPITHDRKIITNYGYLESGAGFSIIDRNGICQVAEGSMQSVASSVDSSYTVRTLQVLHIKWLEKLFTQEEGGGATYSYIVGDKINRLF